MKRAWRAVQASSLSIGESDVPRKEWDLRIIRLRRARKAKFLPVEKCLLSTSCTYILHQAVKFAVVDIVMPTTTVPKSAVNATAGASASCPAEQEATLESGTSVSTVRMAGIFLH